MSGNKHDNGVLEVGTDEITQSYSEDTPGQHVEQFIKEREKSFHAEQKRTQKQFSQVFQNPLDGYPYNEEIKVRPIKEDFGIFEAKDLNDMEFDIKQYSKMYKSAKFKETKKGIEVKVKGKKHMITKHPMQNAWVVDGRNTHMIPSINTAIGIIMSKYEEVTEESLNEETVIDIARRVIDKGGAEKVKGVMLDTFTASAIVQVYDKVNDSNKQKMEKMPLPKLAAAVWKILGK